MGATPLTRLLLRSLIAGASLLVLVTPASATSVLGAGVVTVQQVEDPEEDLDPGDEEIDEEDPDLGEDDPELGEEEEWDEEEWDEDGSEDEDVDEAAPPCKRVGSRRVVKRVRLGHGRKVRVRLMSGRLITSERPLRLRIDGGGRALRSSSATLDGHRLPFRRGRAALAPDELAEGRLTFKVRLVPTGGGPAQIVVLRLRVSACE